MITGNELSKHLFSLQQSLVAQGKNHSNWKMIRDLFLNNFGIGGAIINGKKVDYFPEWWNIDQEFWFYTEQDEIIFRLKYL